MKLRRLGLLKFAIIDQHFIVRHGIIVCFLRWLNTAYTCIGIDEATAIMSGARR